MHMSIGIVEEYIYAIENHDMVKTLLIKVKTYN